MPQGRTIQGALAVARAARGIAASAWLGTLLVAVLALAAAAAGWLQPLDRFIQEKRFSLDPRHASGAVAVLDIDSASLNAVGVWPWPRALHGRIVDRLMALGAKRVFFDIDFSAASNPVDDAAFAEALRRANGKASLAAFEQPSANGDGRVVNTPTEQLAQQSQLVAVDVPIDPDGYVRDYSSQLPVGDRLVETMATRIAGAWLDAPAFGIDFGIDIGEIDRIPAADLLNGVVAADRVAGKDIVVGASAEELRDLFMTPRAGMIPGAVIHAAAAESLMQGRQMRDLGFAWLVALLLALALGAGALGLRISRPWGFAAALSSSACVEAAALAAEHGWGYRVPTSVAHLAIAGFVIIGLVADLRLRRKLHAIAARERDVVRAMLARVVADNFDGVVVVNSQGLIISASRFARDLIGRELEGGDALAALPAELAHPLADALAAGPLPSGPAATPGETRVIAASGDARLLEFVITVSAIEGTRARLVACLTFRDITERRAHEARLDYLARHDELTGAWSRIQLAEKMAEALAGPDGSLGLTLFVLDLRRFVLVNDVFGHKVGDGVLNAVVARIRDIGYADVARLGGDCFAFVGPGEPDADGLARLGQRALEHLCEPYLVENHPIIIGASLGATTTASSGRDPSTLLTHASMAQASAKKLIGDVFKVFTPRMEVLRREKQIIDADLRHAIADGSLALQYQPKVSLDTGRFIGAEALMRWRLADGSPVSPAKFVPVAEESGLIVELGRWALHRACAEAKGWPDETTVAVNVSPIQFALSDVFEEVKMALWLSGLPARRLEIEITESIFVDRESAISLTLDKLRALGVSIALDDFGTGYSSLHYLGRLPIDTIKIDQSFIRRLLIDPPAAATVKAIVALAQAHGKHLVAEGIEEVEQAKALLELGCEFGQGYYYGRPQDAEVLREAFAKADGVARDVMAA